MLLSGLACRAVRICAGFVHKRKRTPGDGVERTCGIAELDTQLMIAEMQGYAPYAHEMKARIIGLMAAIRKFTAALRK